MKFSFKTTISIKKKLVIYFKSMPQNELLLLQKIMNKNLNNCSFKTYIEYLINFNSSSILSSLNAIYYSASLQKFILIR